MAYVFYVLFYFFSFPCNVSHCCPFSQLPHPLKGLDLLFATLLWRLSQTEYLYPPENSYIETVTPSVMVSGGEAFVKRLGHGGAALMMGWLPWEREASKLSHPFHHVRTQPKDGQEVGLRILYFEGVGSWILYFPASWTVRNKCLSFKPPSLWHLLYQSALRKTGPEEDATGLRGKRVFKHRVDLRFTRPGLLGQVKRVMIRKVGLKDDKGLWIRQTWVSRPASFPTEHEHVDKLFKLLVPQFSYL